jgi:predicted nucleic acid-binding protein
MTYLVDTDIVSLTHKRYLPPKLAQWLSLNETNCFISTVTLAEMRFGAAIAPEGHREALLADIEKTESDFSEAIEPVTLIVLVEWKRISAFLKKERRTISCEDSLLAAQCLAGDHTMATNNLAHFKLLEPLGLKVVNPLA